MWTYDNCSNLKYLLDQAGVDSSTLSTGTRSMWPYDNDCRNLKYLTKLV